MTCMLCLTALAAVAPAKGSHTTPKTAQEALPASDDDATDWSKEKHIAIPMPVCAYANLTGIEDLPTEKTDVRKAWMAFDDQQGNTFTKRILIHPHGDSTMSFPKKNLSITFCEDEWKGDKTTDITIGEWVEQDAFHLKAYYTDYVRGIGVAGYQLYDQMLADEGRIWERSGQEPSDERARCYPDGFPVCVYLNGSFYGIYAWQLKKHRKNMGMKKSATEQVHLDGKLYNEYLWMGNIDWTQFEVKNPKNLYTMDGSPYDGDNPKELIDETSPAYSAGNDSQETKEDKERTAQVKHSIASLSRIHAELSAMENSHAQPAELRAYIESRFDVTGIIDYICFNYVVSNYDGFGKNWQWFTYDGQKWFVAPYDLDGIMGNFFTGRFVLPPTLCQPSRSFTYVPSSGPAYWVNKYYLEDIKERYRILREEQVFHPESIYQLVKDWHNRIGADNYQREWERWPQSYCIGKTIANKNWKLIDNWENFSATPDYAKDVTYQEGDRCRYNYRIWEATASTTGIVPAAQMGYQDSLWRIKAWIYERMALVDEYLGIEGFDDTVLGMPDTKAETESAAIRYIYDLRGIRHASLSKGLNIVVGNDGKTRKVFVR